MHVIHNDNKQLNATWRTGTMPLPVATPYFICQGHRFNPGQRFNPGHLDHVRQPTGIVLEHLFLSSVALGRKAVSQVQLCHVCRLLEQATSGIVLSRNDSPECPTLGHFSFVNDCRHQVGFLIYRHYNSSSFEGSDCLLHACLRQNRKPPRKVAISYI